MTLDPADRVSLLFWLFQSREYTWLIDSTFILAAGNLTKPFQINLSAKLLTSTQVEHKNKNGKLCKKIRSQQHPVFPGGHPSKY